MPGTVVFYLLRYYGIKSCPPPELLAELAQFDGSESMAHHNTVRRHPPVIHYDVVAWIAGWERMAHLHDGLRGLSGL